jgi:hypothetical protein
MPAVSSKEKYEARHPTLTALRDFKVTVPNLNILPRAVDIVKGIPDNTANFINKFGKAPAEQVIPLTLPSGAQTVLGTTPNLRAEDYNRASEKALQDSIVRMKNWPK